MRARNDGKRRKCRKNRFPFGEWSSIINVPRGGLKPLPGVNVRSRRMLPDNANSIPAQREPKIPWAGTPKLDWDGCAGPAKMGEVLAQETN